MPDHRPAPGPTTRPHATPARGLPSADHELADGRIKLYRGDSLHKLAALPDGCVNTTVTSPPYFGLRTYAGDSTLGGEATLAGYIANLTAIFEQVYRVTRPDGSLWLNLGDTYDKKRLLGVPWRVAFALESVGWILRQDIVWDKRKGNPDNSADRLRGTHEYVFHLVKQNRYHYDLSPVRTPPAPPTIRADGTVVTPTGMSGSGLRRQIEQSLELTDLEKGAATAALDVALEKVKTGEMPDFRMLIRGGQRSTHGDDPNKSGRARELQQHGFAILPYNKGGSKPATVWAITSEQGGKRRTDKHTAVYPEQLCRVPILTTCPADGVVLDPFVGTGTTCAAAYSLDRRSIGIDSSQEYLDSARERLHRLVAASNGAATK